MIGKEVIEQIVENIAANLHSWAETIFGPQVQSPVAWSLSWADLLVILMFILLGFAFQAAAMVFLRRRINSARARSEEPNSIDTFWNTLGKPLYLFIWVSAAHLVAIPLLVKFDADTETHVAYQIINAILDLGYFITLVWAAFRFTTVIESLLARATRRSESRFDDLLVPLVGKILRIVVPVLGVILGQPLIGLSPGSSEVVRKLSSLLIISCVAWILFQAVKLFERLVLTKYDIKAADNLEARKAYTQVHVLSRALYFLIIIFAIASMLMMFEEVRRFGASILASAGVLGIIIGFAAQRTIANLFAGFQLAMTQPIRIDDVVVIEGEWGRVEEITLTYVIIKIWDQRRLVVPLSYFIEKPFQNWTRVSGEILGSVLLYADYTMPIESIRAETKRIVEAHPDWDKRFWNVQITDATERAIQLRVLATASDSGKAWNLRCDIRERLIDFMQKRHKESLPKVRAEVFQELAAQHKQPPSQL